VKNWIAALRLKTLPLAIGAILLGSQLDKTSFEWNKFIFAVATAILLQILSNLANDYGDFQKGTDKHRTDRQLSTGSISSNQMLSAIILFVVLSLSTGLYLLQISFGGHWNYWLLYLGLGVASIIVAITYTVGKNAYGYLGLGDVFVFIFFGLVGVLGASFLFNQIFNWTNLLPAIAYGCLCIGVLNVNNIRDISKDVLTNKLTLATKLGHTKAIQYQLVLMIVSIVAFVSHHVVNDYFSLAPIALVILSVFHFSKLKNAIESKDYNAQLKLLSIGSLFVTIVFSFELFA
jgi:1,4-dihydroxy-2-naphthoate octaprenyltransferase